MRVVKSKGFNVCYLSDLEFRYNVICFSSNHTNLFLQLISDKILDYSDINDIPNWAFNSFVLDEKLIYEPFFDSEFKTFVKRGIFLSEIIYDEKS